MSTGLLCLGVHKPIAAAGGGGGGDITVVQDDATIVDNAASAAQAFGSNVTAGNKVIVMVAAFSNNTFVAGDCTKTAGTSTIGTVALVAEEQQAITGFGTMNAAIWSADVTGTGSLTMTVDSGIVGDYWVIAVSEINSSTGFDAGYLEDTAIAATDTDDTAPQSGNMTSAGNAIFFGVLAPDNESNAITPDGAFTTIIESEDAANHCPGSIIYRIVSTGTTDSCDWTIATGNQGWAIAGCVIKGQ